MLVWILERWDGVIWTGFGLAQDKGQVESSCEYRNETSGSIKCLETIEWPNNWLPEPHIVN
jgi:hypothetical protein